MMRSVLRLLGVVLFVVLPCGISAQTADPPTHGFDLANVDRTVKPCDDFYQFAAGGWIKNNPIPPAYSQWGSFNILHNRNEDALHQILEEASKDKSAAPGSNWQKIGDFYASCMDETAIEAAGIKPLDPEFRRIAAIHDAASLEAEIARLQLQGVNAAFGFGSEVDFKDSTRRIAGVSQGGLGLPERDYYTRDDAKSKEIRDAYVRHVKNMFKLLGDDDAASTGETKAVLAIETSLAKGSTGQVDLRDPDKNYHMTAVARLGELTPHFAWPDYSEFKVDRAPYVENARRGNEYANAYDIAKIGKAMDRGEWVMTPPTVDAYSRASMNDITFPAGILQPPFFDPNRDDAMNYGGMGAVIGHELTHGFDDQGAKFDAQGNLVNWFTPEDLKNFQDRGNCIAKQFDGYEVEPGLHTNGKLVEGESIADFGGLTIAYAALQKALEGKAAPAPIDGFTADQRFFLGWAQIWESNIRIELSRMYVNVNPHPVARFRVNGPLSNMPAFAKAFECDTKSPMVRPTGQRCRIW